jgi:hypothetical protein
MRLMRMPDSAQCPEHKAKWWQCMSQMLVLWINHCVCRWNALERVPNQSTNEFVPVRNPCTRAAMNMLKRHFDALGIAFNCIVHHQG